MIIGQQRVGLHRAVQVGKARRRMVHASGAAGGREAVIVIMIDNINATATTTTNIDNNANNDDNNQNNNHNNKHINYDKQAISNNNRHKIHNSRECPHPTLDLMPLGVLRFAPRARARFAVCVLVREC